MEVSNRSPLLQFKAENWSGDKFWLDVAVAAPFLFALPIIENARDQPLPYWMLLIVAAFVPLLATSTQSFRIRGTAYGGWFLVVVFFIDLYLVVLNPTHLDVHSVQQVATSRFASSYAALSHNGNEFKDVYLLLATAAFTLTGLTFIAVRTITRTVAVRLTLIVSGYSFVFLLCVPALLQREEGWHRLALMSLLNTTAIFSLTADYSGAIVDYIKDSEPAIEFWTKHADTVRGLSLFGYLGLALVPLFPTFGEVVFVLMLSYVVAQSTGAAYFLYLSSKLRDTKDQDLILRSLFGINLSRKTRKALKYVESYRGKPSARATKVFWIAGSGVLEKQSQDARG